MPVTNRLKETEAPPPGALLLTIPQVAHLLGCSLAQVRALVAEGRLRNVSFDRMVRIRRMDVLRVVDGKRPAT